MKSFNVGQRVLLSVRSLGLSSERGVVVRTRGSTVPSRGCMYVVRIEDGQKITVFADNLRADR